MAKAIKGKKHFLPANRIVFSWKDKKFPSNASMALNSIAKHVKEAEAFQRVYEQMLSPLSWKQVQKTNTSILQRKLNVKFPHFKRWTNAPVAGTNSSVPLDATQQAYRGLGYALKNREENTLIKFNRCLFSNISLITPNAALRRA